MNPADPGAGAGAGAAAAAVAVNQAGRYVIFEKFAAGGMASVHFGLLRGSAGFRRVVAVKRLHAQLAHDPDLVAMFLDEARLASRVRHPNVVPILDVVQEGEEVLLVMDYVAGEALSRLLRAAGQRGELPPPGVAVAIAAGVLHGLHAAHEARDDRGEPLDLVHRDVSPQNVLVGVEGVARVVDFGIAKATGRSQTTRDGQLKGKMPYMAPEQLRSGAVSRQSDVWSAAVVLWEMLAGKRLFDADSEGHLYHRIVNERAPAPSSVAPSVPRELDAVVIQGLSRRPERRFATAREMALALEACLPPATAAQVGAWVESLAHESLAKRASRLSVIERDAPELAPATAAAAAASTAPAAASAMPASAAPISAAPASAAPVGTAPVSAAPISAAPVSATPVSAAPINASLAAATPVQAAPARRRSVALLAGVGIAIVAGISAPLALRTPGERVIVDGAAPAASSPALLSSPAPQAPAASAAASSASAAAPSEPGAAPSASAGATAPRPAAGAGSSKAPRGAKPGAAPPRGERCYTLDQAGIWHIKPECL